MTRIANVEQARAWNGYEGTHCAAHDDRYDAVDGGFNRFVLRAASIGERDRIVDIGCGTGQLARQAAVHARFGQVLGIDLSEPMLARARERAAAENLGRLSFERGDAQIHEFPPAAFDLALSRFGVMFFGDPVAAFANIGRALRPGGRLVFVCRANFSGTDLGTVFDATAAWLPRPTGADGTGPTSLADPIRTRAILTGAGFDDVTCVPVEAEQVYGRDLAEATEFVTSWGPVRYHLGRIGHEAAARAREAVESALVPFVEPGAVRLRGRAWLVTASRRRGLDGATPRTVR